MNGLIRGHNSIGVVRNIDVESGVHLFIRVIGGRVLDHGDVALPVRGLQDRLAGTGPVPR